LTYEKVRRYIERRWWMTEDFLDTLEYAFSIWENSGFGIPTDVILETLYKVNRDEFLEELDSIKVIFGLTDYEIRKFLESVGERR